jgi:hypothetical protein
MSCLFNIVVTANSANHGDGTNENYAFEAYAPNGEALTFKGTGYTLADAAADFARSVRHVQLPDHLSLARDGARPGVKVIEQVPLPFSDSPN